MSAVPGTDLEIRAARDGDLDDVIALWRACDLVVPWNDPHRDIALCRSSPQSELLVGVLDGRLVGALMAGSDGHRGWLYYLAVDPGLRRAGHARALVREAERWLGSLGVRKVELMIRDSNAPVRAFYERLGYAAEPRIVMARWLDEAGREAQRRGAPGTD